MMFCVIMCAYQPASQQQRTTLPCTYKVQSSSNLLLSAKNVHWPACPGIGLAGLYLSINQLRLQLDGDTEGAIKCRYQTNSLVYRVLLLLASRHRHSALSSVIIGLSPKGLRVEGARISLGLTLLTNYRF